MKMISPTPALVLTGLLLVFTSGPANAQLFDAGSSGRDGEFHATGNIEINLGAAVNDDTEGRTAGTGVFDEEHFAIVFHYTSITIDPGVVVTFKNHPVNPPVIWLSQGDVEIAGRVDVSGKRGLNVLGGNSTAAPGGAGGPGGYQGGNGQPLGWPGASDGLGPGSGKGGPALAYNISTEDEDYVGHANTRTRPYLAQRPSNGLPYGSDLLVPFSTVGSGGGGSSTVDGGSGGGGGGGSVLIASNTSIVIKKPSGLLLSGGGGSGDQGTAGAGSPGCFRLVAPVVRGDGAIQVNNGGEGGVGIIRIDAIFKEGLAFNTGDADFSVGANMMVFPATVPKVEVTGLRPTGSADWVTPDGAVPVVYDTTEGSPPLEVDIRVQVSNFPPNGNAFLTVRVTPEFERQTNYDDVEIMVDSEGVGTGVVTGTMMSVAQLNRIDVWTRTPTP